MTTAGMNPYQLSDEQLAAILQLELLPQLQSHAHGIMESPLTIHFYGAGCTPAQCARMKNLVENIFPKSQAEIASDMLGAARALAGTEPALVGILGTGANTCRYDGHEMVDNIAPLGYVLGDEGSGAYIGKMLIMRCVKRLFSPALCQRFFEETQLSPADIIEHVYRQPLPNRFLARQSEFCTRHKGDEEVQRFLSDCFEAFLMNNVLPYQQPDLPLHLTGSIAWHYRDEVKRAAEKCGVKIGRIQQAPIEGMVKYHQQCGW